MIDGDSIPLDGWAEEDHPILLFDGVCNLCIWSVQFIIERDPQAHFRFASLQSPIGQAYLARCGMPVDALDTFLLVEGKRCYARSDAALRVAGKLAGWWPLLGLFRVVPAGVRDLVYRLIARNRYRWFGVQEYCLVPTPELNQRFVSEQLESSAGG